MYVKIESGWVRVRVIQAEGLGLANMYGLGLGLKMKIVTCM